MQRRDIRPFLRWCSLFTLALPLVFSPTLWADGPGDDEREREHHHRLILKHQGTPRLLANQGALFGSGGYLGVQLTELSPTLRTVLGVPQQQGVMVEEVMDESPAASAGLRAGDVIVEVGGEEVGSASHLGRLVRAREEGDVLDIAFLRDGVADATTATLAASTRRVIDLSSVMDAHGARELLEKAKGLQGLEGLNEWEGITEDALAQARKALEQALDSNTWESYREGWEASLERLEAFDMEALEARMEALQKSLQELERRFEENDS